MIAAPLLAAVLLLVAGLGRIAEARGQVDGAAREAARTASLQPAPAGAAAAGQAAANALLAGQHLHCAVTVDPSADRPGGQVSATVTCTVGLADLSLAGFGHAKTLTATATVPIETFRGLP